MYWRRVGVKLWDQHEWTYGFVWIVTGTGIGRLTIPHTAEGHHEGCVDFPYSWWSETSLVIETLVN